MDWINANLEHILFAATTIIAIAAHLAALTPTPDDDKVIAKAKKLLDYIAGNYGNARNKK
jgi:hypothetical protein